MDLYFNLSLPKMNIRPDFTFIDNRGYRISFLKGRSLGCSAINIDFKGFLTTRDFLSYIFDLGTLLRSIVYVINISLIDGFKMRDTLMKECELLRIPKMVRRRFKSSKRFMSLLNIAITVLSSRLIASQNMRKW
jgi:hypothetical protein